MRAIRSIDVESAIKYGAVLAALWTLVFGIYYWLLGWIFAGQAWFIDVNVANWTAYTFGSLLSVIWRMIVNGIGGALAGWILALMYNAAADFMGGIKINLE